MNSLSHYVVSIRVAVCFPTLTSIMASPQLPVQVPSSLSSLPEELISRILADCVIPPQTLPLRPSWHTLPLAPSSSFPGCRTLLLRPSLSNTSRSRLSPLLVSRQFLRICTPLYYQTLHLSSVTHAARVFETLVAQPRLADAVRRVVLGCISLEGAHVLRTCEMIEDVDICMDVGTEGNGLGSAARDLDAEALCDALQQIDLKRLTIRKASHAYLTNMRPKYVLERIAKAVPSWPNLVRSVISLMMDHFLTVIFRNMSITHSKWVQHQPQFLWLML